MAIASNSIRNVGAAIWGSVGEHVAITGNSVDGCSDVCLDAEASSEVTISGNTVRNAVNGGITTFYGSSHLVISSNTVYQDSNHGSAIFIHGSGVTQNALVSDNNLQVSGSYAIQTAQGALANSAIQSNIITSTSFAAILILEGNGVDILSNKIWVAGPAAIEYQGPSRGSILNNIITNTATGLSVNTGTGGIHIYWRSGTEPAQFNIIENNTILNFPISINDDCWGNNTSFNVMNNNAVDNIYHRGSGAAYLGVIKNNYANSNPNILVGGTGY